MATTATGLILLVHGSRDPDWLIPFAHLRDAVSRQRPETHVCLACLQFGEPDLPTAIATMLARRINKVTVVPVFLSRSGHVARDIPPLVERCRKRHPDLALVLAPALCDLPGAFEALADCIAQAL